MRRLLTIGIKAILAIAALSTAAHWALRVQREPSEAPAGMAAIPDPVSTGSIVPRKVERPAAITEAEVTKGLDQQHLLKLITDASSDRKSTKLVAKR